MTARHSFVTEDAYGRMGEGVCPRASTHGRLPTGGWAGHLRTQRMLLEEFIYHVEISASLNGGPHRSDFFWIHHSSFVPKTGANIGNDGGDFFLLSEAGKPGHRRHALARIELLAIDFDRTP